MSNNIKSVLVAGSSANPAHNNHLDMFIIARTFLDKYYPERVEKGVLVLAHQKHLESKGVPALLLKDRQIIFQTLADERKLNDWLSASDESHANCIEYAKTKFPGYRIFEVLGQDMARKRNDDVTRVIIGRDNAKPIYEGEHIKLQNPINFDLGNGRVAAIEWFLRSTIISFN